VAEHLLAGASPTPVLLQAQHNEVFGLLACGGILIHDAIQIKALDFVRYFFMVSAFVREVSKKKNEYNNSGTPNVDFVVVLVIVQ